MAPENWEDADAHCLGLLLDGRAQPTGIPRRGDDLTVLLVLNAHHEAVRFVLPAAVGGAAWKCVMDTGEPDRRDEPRFEFGAGYDVTGRSLLLFELVMDPDYVAQ